MHPSGKTVQPQMTHSVLQRPRAQPQPLKPLAGVLIGLASLCIANDALALAFGPVRVLSAPHQPLRAEVELLDVRDAPVSVLALPTSSVRDRAFGATLPYGIRSQLVRLPDGRQFVRLTSTQVVAESALSFALQVDDGEGVLVRDFAVQLAQPTASAARPAPVDEPARRADDRGPKIRDVAAGEFPLVMPGGTTRNSSYARRSPGAAAGNPGGSYGVNAAPAGASAARGAGRKTASQAQPRAKVAPSRTRVAPAPAPASRYVEPSRTAPRAQAAPARRPPPQAPALPQRPLPVAPAPAAPPQPKPLEPARSQPTTEPTPLRVPAPAASGVALPGAPSATGASVASSTHSAPQIGTGVPAPIVATPASAPPATASAAPAASIASAAASAPVLAASGAASGPDAAASVASAPASAASAALVKPKPDAPVAQAPGAGDDDGFPWQWIGGGLAAALLAAALFLRRGGKRQDPLQPLQPGPANPEDAAAASRRAARPPSKLSSAAEVAVPAATTLGGAVAAPPARGFSADSAPMSAQNDSGMSVFEHHGPTSLQEAGEPASVIDNRLPSEFGPVDVHAEDYAEFSNRLADAQDLLEQGRDQEAAEAAREILDVCDALEAELAAIAKEITKG